MALQATTYYEIYRKSTVGDTLDETLQQFVSERCISPQFRKTMLETFDRIMSEELAEVEGSKITHFKAHLSKYRFCDDLWTFVLRRMTCTIDNNHVSCAGPIMVFTALITGFTGRFL